MKDFLGYPVAAKDLGVAPDDMAVFSDFSPAWNDRSDGKGGIVAESYAYVHISTAGLALKIRARDRASFLRFLGAIGATGDLDRGELKINDGALMELMRACGDAATKAGE